MKKNKHTFALFFPATHTLQKNFEQTIDDKDVIQRLAHILRIQKDDELVFFNKEVHATVLIRTITKKSISVFVQHIEKNTTHKPHITFLLPLLKKDAFETALYSLVECGATEIIPIITQKVHRNWWQPKDEIRLQKIIHAAAEQSKNFAFPQLHTPIPLTDALKKVPSKSTKLFFDPTGAKMISMIENNKNETVFVLWIGPEGDVTQEEKNVLQKNNFIFTALTRTILRAQQAAALTTGMLRSLVTTFMFALYCASAPLHANKDHLDIQTRLDLLRVTIALERSALLALELEMFDLKIEAARKRIAHALYKQKN